MVYGEDHIGHGRSDGERALITDFEHVVDDLRTLVDIALTEHPGLPVVMIGHSMGGLLTSRFAQEYPDGVAGIVLLGAVIGDWNWAREALAQPELPPATTDFSGMSRDTTAVEAYATDPLIYRGQYKRALLEAEVVALDRFRAQVDTLIMPVLFCHGTDDPFVDYRTSLAAVQSMPSKGQDDPPLRGRPPRTRERDEPRRGDRRDRRVRRPGHCSVSTGSNPAQPPSGNGTRSQSISTVSA